MNAAAYRWIVLLTCAGMIVPQAALASSSGSRVSAPIADVSLDGSGRLVGQMVDVNGTALPTQPLVISQRGREIARTSTDSQGQFALTGLRGGIYEVTHSRGGSVVRVWTAQAAPPSARQGLLVVAGENLARGQVGSALELIGSPITLAVVTATAVAVPLALDSSDGS